MSWLDGITSNHANGLPLEQQQFDAVVMLAGGLLPDGGLPPWVTRRLDTCFDIAALQQRPCPVLCLGEQGAAAATLPTLVHWRDPPAG